MSRFEDSGWIYENNIDEHCWLEASLPYGGMEEAYGNRWVRFREKTLNGDMK